MTNERRDRAQRAESRQIDLIYFDGCPNVAQTRKNLRRALASLESGERWQEWNLSSEDTPAHFRRFGSPTVLVDGRDVTGEEGSGQAGAMACRAGGPPTVDDLLEALRTGA